MRSIRKSGVTALTAAIALSLGAIPVALTVPSLVASGETPSIAPASAPTQPKLVLTTTADNQGSVKLYDGAGDPVGAAQTLTASGCALQSNGSKFLSFAGMVKATAKPSGFLKGSIGVAEKTSGVSCGRADSPSEMLTLALDSGVIGSLGKPMLATAATLDVDLKGGARIKAVASGGGETLNFELQSGSSVNPADAANPSVRQCTAGSDSGPDSGANDNCDWTIRLPEGKYFKKLELTAVAGSFALSGGADYGTASAPSHVSTIELFDDVDGVLACADNPDTPDVDESLSILRDFDTGKTRVQIRRIGNADPAETCKLLPYTLDNNATKAEALYYKPLDKEKSAQFIVDLTWQFDVTKYPTPADLPATTIDFELKKADGTPALGPVKMGWCPDPLFTATGQFNGVSSPSTLTDMVDNDTTNTKQYACFGTREARLVEGKTYYELHEEVYLLGDAAWRP